MTFIFWKTVFHFYPRRTHILQWVPRKFRFSREGSSDIKILKSTELELSWSRAHRTYCVYTCLHFIGHILTLLRCKQTWEASCMDSLLTHMVRVKKGISDTVFSSLLHDRIIFTVFSTRMLAGVLYLVVQKAQDCKLNIIGDIFFFLNKSAK